MSDKTKPDDDRIISLSAYRTARRRASRVSSVDAAVMTAAEAQWWEAHEKRSRAFWKGWERSRAAAHHRKDGE
jgi:hypothetical protein